MFRSILYFLLRPTIRLVEWAHSQGSVIRNAKLLPQLDAKDSKSVCLYGKVSIHHPENCHLGRSVHIHECDWNAEGGITIGDCVHFGPRTTILTQSHNYEGETIPYDSTHILKPVVIESYVWVGCDVVIAPGTHIEEGCVIAMGATVSGRIPKGSIVGAAKWRLLKQRDMEKFERLKQAGKIH